MAMIVDLVVVFLLVTWLAISIARQLRQRNRVVRAFIRAGLAPGWTFFTTPAARVDLEISTRARLRTGAVTDWAVMSPIRRSLLSLVWHPALAVLSVISECAQRLGGYLGRSEHWRRWDSPAYAAMRAALARHVAGEHPDATQFQFRIDAMRAYDSSCAAEERFQSPFLPIEGNPPDVC